MIAKCSLLAILVVVVSARPGNGDFEDFAFPNSDCDCQSQSCPISLVPSGSSSGAINRNLIGKGKYPVALSSCGPTPDYKIPVTTSHFTAPVQEKPTVRLPAKIPPPRVISHTCTCYRTILRPTVQQQVVNVPSVQPFINTCSKPVVERFQFDAETNNCQSPVQVFPSVQAVQPVETFPVQPLESFQGVQVPQNIHFGSNFGC